MGACGINIVFRQGEKKRGVCFQAKMLCVGKICSFLSGMEYCCNLDENVPIWNYVS
jgi:hypothetical protein